MSIQDSEIAQPLDGASGQSLTIRAYTELRERIISGALRPGQRLKIESLRDQIGAGATPIREALSLLTSDGLVERLDKRGFRVSGVSLADYDDLHRTRCFLEEHALRESIARGDQAWEDRLVLVTHRLRRLPRTVANEAGTHSNPEWERMHKTFHMTLLAGSPSPTLIQFCDQLHDRLNRYRSLAATGGQGLSRDWKTEHEGIAEAAINRDVEESIARLMQHYERTTEILRITITRDYGQA
jgi:GntR family transcriptional regulator, carbon starvation induced regulator